MRLGGLGQLKNPITSGIEPATFQLVAQWLNQLRYHVPPIVDLNDMYILPHNKLFYTRFELLPRAENQDHSLLGHEAMY
jgi:hypothetical protein